MTSTGTEQVSRQRVLVHDVLGQRIETVERDSGSRRRPRYWCMRSGRDANCILDGAKVNECCWLCGRGPAFANSSQPCPPNMEAGGRTASSRQKAAMLLPLCALPLETATLGRFLWNAKFQLFHVLLCVVVLGGIVPS